jgi:hypothetical protein
VSDGQTPVSRDWVLWSVPMEIDHSFPGKDKGGRCRCKIELAAQLKMAGESWNRGQSTNLDRLAAAVSSGAGKLGSRLNSEILDSFAPAYLKLVRFPARSPLSIAALPSTSLFPKAPFDLSVCPSMSSASPRLHSRAKHLTFAKTGCPFCARYARPIPPNTLRREIARQRLTLWLVLCCSAVFAT